MTTPSRPRVCTTCNDVENDLPGATLTLTREYGDRRPEVVWVCSSCVGLLTLTMFRSGQPELAVVGP